MPLDILCPEGTIIRDYAYPESHPLHTSNYPTSQRSLLSSTDESDLDEYDSDDYIDEEAFAPEEINRKAVALFEFEPENDNEFALKEGQEIWISYRHGQGWLVAEDLVLGESGLVPEGYVDICTSGEESLTKPQEEVAEPFVPKLLQNYKNAEDDSEWEDVDSDESAQDESVHEEETGIETIDSGLKAAKLQ